MDVPRTFSQAIELFFTLSDILEDRKVNGRLKELAEKKIAELRKNFPELISLDVNVALLAKEVQLTHVRPQWKGLYDMLLMSMSGFNSIEEAKTAVQRGFRGTAIQIDLESIKGFIAAYNAYQHISNLTNLENFADIQKTIEAVFTKIKFDFSTPEGFVRAIDTYIKFNKLIGELLEGPYGLVFVEKKVIELNIPHDFTTFRGIENAVRDLANRLKQINPK